jgi:hypothetical protein
MRSKFKMISGGRGEILANYSREKGREPNKFF